MAALDNRSLDHDSVQPAQGPRHVGMRPGRAAPTRPSLRLQAAFRITSWVSESLVMGWSLPVGGPRPSRPCYQPKPRRKLIRGTSMLVTA